MQPYLWWQAEGARHAFSTDENRGYRPVAGQPFKALCGREVTPQATDMVVGTWFDPECEACLQELCKLSGWSPEEIDKLLGIRGKARSEDE